MPGVLLERLVQPDPQRREASLQSLLALLEQQRQQLLLRPLPSGNPPQGLLTPDVRSWNWGAFLSGPLWAAAHGMWGLGLLVAFLFWTFPVVNIVLANYGGALAWRQRRFPSMEDFVKVQRAWAFTGLVLFPIQMALVVLLLILLFG